MPTFKAVMSNLIAAAGSYIACLVVMRLTYSWIFINSNGSAGGIHIGILAPIFAACFVAPAVALKLYKVESWNASALVAMTATVAIMVLGGISVLITWNF